MREYLRKLNSKITLYVRFVIILLINSIVIFGFVSVVSYNTIKNQQKSRLENSILFSVSNVSHELNTIYSVLSDMTLMVATEDQVIEALGAYCAYNPARDKGNTEAALAFGNAWLDIKGRMNIITSFNHNIGYAFIYSTSQDLELIADNIPGRFYKDLTEQQIVPLYQNGTLQANGIHQSMENEEQQVISVTREIVEFQEKPLSIYMETDTDYVRTLLKNNKFCKDAFFVLTDMNDQVIFSENEVIVPKGAVMIWEEKEDWSVWKDDHYIFRTEGLGFSVIELIPRTYFTLNVSKWIGQLGMILLITLAIVAGVAVLIWRMIYRPIRILRNEFQMMAVNAQRKRGYTGVREFDGLLDEFYNAKKSMLELNQRILEKERKQKEIEIEKIIMQINPHFIRNTLNCIQWMARMNGNKDIENMVLLFIRVLNYNLGKKNIFVTVLDEIDAIKNYVDLQKMKKNIQMNLAVDVAPQLRDCLIPRFILQPLVENAIAYGNPADGNSVIEVTAEKWDEECFLLSVQDNGQGMSEEVIAAVTDCWNDNKNMGIGLKYVTRMIRFYCGEKADIYVESGNGKGTKISLKIPVFHEVNGDDKNIDS